jgi:uncharacterized membrane protein
MPKTKEQQMSDLIVMSFNSVATAEEVRDKVRQLQKGGQLALSDAAVITKDADGKVEVKNEVSRETKVGAGVGAVLGAVMSFVFPIAGIVVGTAGGAAVGAMVGNGVDRKFVEDVQNSLTPGSSALFLVLRGGDAAALRGVLEPFEGTLIQTTFDSNLEEQLRDALK